MRGVWKWIGIGFVCLVLLGIGSALGQSSPSNNDEPAATPLGKDGEQAALEDQLADIRSKIVQARSELREVRDDISAAERRLTKAKSRARRAEREANRTEQRVARTQIPGDGTYMVGEDIEPGTYRADNASETCYWARLSGLGGDLGDIIANDIGGGQSLVTIQSSDLAFETNGCGTFSKVG